jgi:hypothetical protein
MSSFVNITETREAAEKVYSGISSVPFGWQLDTTFGDGGQREGPSGGYVYALKPVGVDDGRRMLVFRGTEVTLTNMKDLFADVTDIGKIQFDELRADVNQWLAQELVAGRRVELVGHSLGGALVQWAINDTNMRDENSENNATILSVLERARIISGNDNFQIDPSKPHFTTFNAPGITHVLGGSTPATDRTSVVIGEHHVVMGVPPIVQRGKRFLTPFRSPRCAPAAVARLGERANGGDGGATDPTVCEPRRAIRLGNVDCRDGGLVGTRCESPTHRPTAETGGNVECPHFFTLTVKTVAVPLYLSPLRSIDDARVRPHRHGGR